MQTQSKEPQLLILLLLASFASVSAVLYSPALPEMARELGLPAMKVQLTMTIFAIGYAVGNLPYGPISNRFGRKPAIYMGISVAIVGCLLILLGGALHLFWLIMCGRFLEALGSCVGLKIAFTMIGDVYSQTAATKKLSYLTLAFAIVPGLAVAFGGLLTDQFGWMSCFYVLTVYSVILLILSTRLPETAEFKDLTALNLSKIRIGFLEQLKSRTLVTCALIMGGASSFVYLFASEAPFIGIEEIGLQAKEYGLLNFIPSLGMLVGAVFTHQLAGKKEIPTILTLGIGIAIAASFIMFTLFLIGKVNTWTLFVPIPFMYLGLSLVFSNSSGYAMSVAKNKSNASAVLNFINMTIAFFSLLVIEILPIYHITVLPLLFLLIGIVMLLLRFFFLKNKSP